MILFPSWYILSPLSGFLNLRVCWKCGHFLIDKKVSRYSVLYGGKKSVCWLWNMMNWCFLTIHVCIRHFICKSIVRLKCKWTFKRWYTSVIVYSLAPSLDGLIVLTLIYTTCDNQIYLSVLKLWGSCVMFQNEENTILKRQHIENVPIMNNTVTYSIYFLGNITLWKVSLLLTVRKCRTGAKSVLWWRWLMCY